jgi:preprotein translocase SecE subunit
MAKDKKEEVKKETSFWKNVKNFFVKIGKAIGKFFAKLARVIAGFSVRTYQDVARVRWPNKKTIIAASAVVLSFIFLFGVYIILDDYIVSQVFRIIY